MKQCPPSLKTPTAFSSTKQSSKTTKTTRSPLEPEHSADDEVLISSHQAALIDVFLIIIQDILTDRTT